MCHIPRNCSCGNNEVGKTMRNAITRVNEHDQPNGKSKLCKHLKNNPGHKFDWMTLSRELLQRLKQTILEAYLLNQLNTSLNDSLDSKMSILSRHGVT